MKITFNPRQDASRVRAALEQFVDGEIKLSGKTYSRFWVLETDDPEAAKKMEERDWTVEEVK